VAGLVDAVHLERLDQDLERGVGRAVVGEHDLVLGVAQAEHRADRVDDHLGLVVGRRADRDRRRQARADGALEARVDEPAEVAAHLDPRQQRHARVRDEDEDEVGEHHVVDRHHDVADHETATASAAAGTRPASTIAA
jgi:hypothetical protein